jgi:hypothetical protein
MHSGLLSCQHYLGELPHLCYCFLDFVVDCRLMACCADSRRCKIQQALAVCHYNSVGPGGLPVQYVNNESFASTNALFDVILSYVSTR